MEGWTKIHTVILIVSIVCAALSFYAWGAGNRTHVGFLVLGIFSLATFVPFYIGVCHSRRKGFQEKCKKDLRDRKPVSGSVEIPKLFMANNPKSWMWGIFTIVLLGLFVTSTLSCSGLAHD